MICGFHRGFVYIGHNDLLRAELRRDHAEYAAPMVVFYLLVSIQFFRDAYQTFASIKSGAYLTEHDHDEPSLAEIMHEEKLAESAEHTEAE